MTNLDAIGHIHYKLLLAMITKLTRAIQNICRSLHKTVGEAAHTIANLYIATVSCLAHSTRPIIDTYLDS